MNIIVNKFLLAGDKFMPEMHLKQPRFTYSACGTFTKNKERIQKFKETGDTSYIYKNELDKPCFQHWMAYGDFKDLARRIVSDKFWEIKHLILLKILNMIGIKSFFDRKNASLTDKSVLGSGVYIDVKHIEQLVGELHKLIIKHF